MALVVLRVPVEGGSPEYVDFEVDYPDGDDMGYELVASGNRRIYRSLNALSDSLDRLVPALAALLQRLRAQPEPPDRLEVSVALKLTGEGNLIVAKGSAEAAFAITMTWNR